MIDDLIDLAEARAKIDATSRGLRQAVGPDDGVQLGRLLARLDRIAMELERIEKMVAGRAAAGMRQGIGTVASAQ